MPPRKSSSSMKDTQLGLTAEDLETFRQHRRQSYGLALDSPILQTMASHFDRVSAAMQQRLDPLQREMQITTQRQALQAQTSIRAANNEIARMHVVLRQIDDLELECDKIRRIRDIVRSFPARVEAIESKLAS